MNEAISDLALDLGQWALDRECEQLNIKFPELREVQPANISKPRAKRAGRNHPTQNLRVRHQKGSGERTDTTV